ncbi:MAG: DUF4386 domain-containing protein [Pseudomonadota bacterium]
MAGIDTGRGFSRITGVAYALIFALAIHANFAVIGALPSVSDPEALAAALSSGDLAIKTAVAELLGVMVCDVVVSWGLYRVFLPTSSALNGLSSIFRLTYTIAFIPVILTLLNAEKLASLGVDPALVASQVSAYHQGFTMTLLFFGVHLMLLGWVIASTGRLPRLIAPLVGLAGLGYVLDALLVLLAPELRSAIIGVWSPAVILAALVGEGLLTVVLLIAPVRQVTEN